MNRTEFIVAVALILFAAFVIGWLASWLVHRLTRVTNTDLAELDQMAEALHAAEESRDQANATLAERESELTSRLHQTEAELSAAMEGLRDARNEAEALRTFIETASTE